MTSHIRTARATISAAGFLGTVLLTAGTAFSSMIFSSVSQDSLTVGDRIRFTVGMVVPKGATVVPPAADQGFGSLTVKDWLSDKKEQPGADSFSFAYLLTTYTVDTCTIPELAYLVSVNGKVDTLKTKPIPLKVGSVVTGDTVDIKDLKPQQVAGKPSYWWLWALLAAVVLGAGIWIGRRWFSKSAKAKPEPPPLPPYEEAIEALKRLEAMRYLTQGLVREYVFGLSDIFKRYIKRRFNVSATEFTTEEMVVWIRGSGLERTLKSGAMWFFLAGDQVKFAKLLPGDRMLDRFMKEVRSFLEATKPAPVQQQQPQATNAPSQS